MSETEHAVAPAPKKRHKAAPKPLTKLEVVAEAGGLLEKLPSADRKSALAVLNKYFDDETASPAEG